MFVKNREMYAVKRYLHQNNGIVLPMSRRGIHNELNLDLKVVHRALQKLVTESYLTELGNWQHLWFFVTKEGEQMLREEVGLPEEDLMKEQLEIKN